PLDELARKAVEELLVRLLEEGNAADQLDARAGHARDPNLLRRSKLAGRPVAIEEATQPSVVDRAHQGEGIPDHPGILEAARIDRLEAGVRDQLLDDLARLLLGRVEISGAGALLVDPVVHGRVVAVERLRDRAAGDRLHLVRERLELLVPAAE